MGKRQNILISGGLGRLGLELGKKLQLSRGNDVTVIDNLSNSSLCIACKAQNLGIDVVLEDVRRRKKICRNFDMVFHLAAQTNIEDAQSDPLSNASNNILGTIALIKNYPVRKFIYFSSEEVYGRLRNATEDSRPDPEVAYGFSKLGGEVYVRMLCKNYLILRIAEGVKDINSFVKIVTSLVERDIGGTVNVGDSPRLDCSKLRHLMPFNYEG